MAWAGALWGTWLACSQMGLSSRNTLWGEGRKIKPKPNQNVLEQRYIVCLQNGMILRKKLFKNTSKCIKFSQCRQILALLISRSHAQEPHNWNSVHLQHVYPLNPTLLITHLSQAPSSQGLQGDNTSPFLPHKPWRRKGSSVLRNRLTTNLWLIHVISQWCHLPTFARSS